ncbi:AbrB/MazE/SpoVT family DNA-binding domain-containing protein [Halalkalirubrum salinum]|uniref:AbrB/MazE/SpoVT family DNA-binding domain-containing protein n=1 Tax=Halalkalirubrum salinum TaxID=2563889 RepID=UPI0010FB1C0D|nr:AbrB/MazE/SpoVT family DNA-binding domain-containing protein [Halalkalirubrum salinum]
MRNPSDDESSRKERTLIVDDRGRVTLPKDVREQLGIESNDELPATLVGSVLEINPKPSSELALATAGRDDWENTTPIDAGDALFGSKDERSGSSLLGISVIQLSGSVGIVVFIVGIRISL